MAEALFKPPGELNLIDGNISENFKKWRRQIEVYLEASGSKEKAPETQVAIILHCAGPKAIEIFDLFTWTGRGENVDDKKDPAKVLKKIEGYCNPRKNEVLESHRFWSVQYDVSQGFEPFLTELRSRSESCNFTEKDRMIRDKIVFTMTGKLQELLLREDALDLDKAIKTCRSYEQSNKHVKEIRDTKEQTVHKVNHAKSDKKQNPKKSGQYSTGTVCQNSSSRRGGVKPKSKATHGEKQHFKKSCAFCGYKHEMKKEKCPAWGQTCGACNGRNHFKSRCKKVHSLTTDDTDSEDDPWLQSVQTNSKNKVIANMIVNDCEIKFQVDSGAQVNTICQKYVKKEQARETSLKLRMWNKTSMNSLGESTLPMKNPKTEEVHEVNFVIVPNDYECLLGLKTIQKMNLITVNSELFIGKVEKDLGDLGEVKLRISSNATPVALPARNIPLAIRDNVKDELNKLVDRGVLIPVTEPTEWVNQMAVPRKRNGNIRICLDPQPLNKVLIRERYKLPTFEDILPQLNNAKIFTKLDVKEAYWHVRLDEESSYLTTMITPFGRFRWSRLPFGLSVSSEIFQRKLNEALNGLEGVFTIADDIIVVGCGETEQSAKNDNAQKLEKLNKRCEEQNIVLNDQKKAEGKEITFHGHKITDKGVLPDNDKIEAVLKMKRPTDVTEVRRFCGLVQYMARFLPDLANTLEPIRKLTKNDVEWNWSSECEDAWNSVKTQITNAPILSYFDPDKELVVQVDSSQNGLGAVLLQDGKPIEFASRALKPTERKWAQIEKEALAVLYGLEKFDQYTYGRKVTIQNDHKPLERILIKPLSQAPKRLQDIIMKLFRYDIEFQFVRGSDLVIADALSRDYLDNDEKDEPERLRVCEVSAFEQFPDARITEIKEAAQNDSVMQKLIEVIMNGWPAKRNVDPDLMPYYSFRDTLSHENGVVLKGEAVLIPKSLIDSMKARLHSAHLGFDSMMRRARGTIFWPGMGSEIKQLAKSCAQCEQLKPKNQKETLKQHSDGNGPWDKIATDLFEIKGRHYLLVIDYYSNFIEVDLLQSTTSKQVIEKLKKQFARFGVPRQIISDGGPQYSSAEFQSFVKEWGIIHHITSPNHPQSNGKAEAGVKVIKNMMIKTLQSGMDQNIALLEQRNTPRQDTGLSPSEMMFSRKSRTMLPQKTILSKQSEKRAKRKRIVRENYNKRAKDLPKIKPGKSVYFEHQKQKPWQQGLVKESNSRNYVIENSDGTLYRRNRSHLRPTEQETVVRDTSPPRTSQAQTSATPMPDLADVPAIPPVTVNNDTNQSGSESTIVPERHDRPRREVKPPKYLSDYVRY